MGVKLVVIYRESFSSDRIFRTAKMACGDWIVRSQYAPANHGHGSQQVSDLEFD
jgi:hypothetical protein